MIYIKKIPLIIILLVIFILSFNVSVNAVNEKTNNNSFSEIYDEQIKISGADRLFDALPEQTKQQLKDIKITSPDYETVTNLSISKVFEEIIKIIGANSTTVLGGMTACLGVIILCSLIEGFKITIGEKSIGTISSAVGTICICIAIIIPLCSTISSAVEILNGASGFLLMYVPIMSGLMIASGKEISGASYYSIMMGTGQVISQISSKIIMPLMNIFLTLSVTSALSPKMKFSSLCSSFYNISKWILTFVMSIFVTILSLQTIVTSSMDNVSTKAVRFAINSFVPVVGGALSEALNTFSGSIELLKSGAGVFVIIASAFVFLPVLIECIIWQFSLFFLSSVSEIFGLSQIIGIFKTISKVVSMIIAVLLCTMTIFVISTVIILIVGR